MGTAIGGHQFVYPTPLQPSQFGAPTAIFVCRGSPQPAWYALGEEAGWDIMIWSVYIVFIISVEARPLMGLRTIDRGSCR